MHRISSVCSAFVAVLLSSPGMSGEKEAHDSFAISDQSFRCIIQMTHVRHFYVDNLAGNLKGTVKAAESTTDATYPVGSVLQLVPTEAMVKREKGFNAATHDWEFFDLEVSPGGSTIRTRGFV